MNVDENGSIAKAFLQNMAVFFKWQGKDDNKEGCSIFKNTTLTSHITWQGLVLSSLNLYMI